jgi:hypothetical protein
MAKTKKKTDNDPVQDTTDRIVWTALDILWMWRELVRESEKQTERDPSWYKYDVRQAYQDAMNSMMHNELIETFDVSECRVKIGGVWRNDRRGLRFVQTGPAVPVSLD